MYCDDINRATDNEHLWKACSELDVDGIKKALDEGADINADDG